MMTEDDTAPHAPPAHATAPGEKASLDAGAWVVEALLTLASRGIEGVRIEALARSLGVTKGSFYWHFRDRRALHEAMLDRWQARSVDAPIAMLRTIASPAERYRAMLRLPYGAARPDFDMELAVRLWARNDDLARQRLAAADVLRLRFVEDVLLAAGAPAGLARGRAALVFAFLRVGWEVADESAIVDFEEALLVC